jgi:two-component system, OmpR family, sensor histidine kinase VicK
MINPTQSNLRDPLAKKRTAYFNSSVSEKLMRLAAIVETSQDAIFSKDLNGIVTSWNPGAEKLYGYKAKEIIGKPITLIFPPGHVQEFEQIMSKLKDGEQIEHYATTRVNKFGRRISVSISVSPLKDFSNQIIGASVIARDISEQIELEKRKDDFISIASHELKTPLTTLKGYTQILLNQTLSPSQELFLKKMDLQLDKLTQLVSDLLDASRIKNGKTRLHKEQFDLNALIVEIVSEMQHHTTNHTIKFETKGKMMVNADKYRIGQILTNLLSNAIKYSPQANQIVVASTSTKTAVQFSVQDFGIGVFPKDKKKIFDQFFQARTKIRGSFSGLGLGLYICSEIVRRHKGKIWVESVKGQGSTFFVQLPA